MFLTKENFRRIRKRILGYFLLGSLMIALGIWTAMVESATVIPFIGGGIIYALCPLVFLWGKDVEGKINLINLGRELVREDLSPAIFLREYYALRKSPDLVVCQPSVEVLEFVAVAHECLNEREKVLETVEEMLSVAPQKKRSLVKLVKCSFLFSYGRTEEAEALFFEAQREKPNAVCRLMIDNIWKSDRAIAMGDYKTAEQHLLGQLSKAFPELDNLGKLVTHFSLGVVYEKLAENEKAAEHYRYCAENGGETAIKESAITALERILAL